MILRIYIFILALFVVGGIGFYFINRCREPQTARSNWIKYITYFILIHLLFASIVFLPHIFRWVALLIVLVGLFEMIRLFAFSGYAQKGFFSIAIILYASFAIGFYHFSGMDSGLILFVFMVLSIFDAFSQITGQLTGRTKILPRISPSKTLEGFIGGAIFAIAGSLAFRGLTSYRIHEVLILSSLVVFAAFVGDAASSIYKRRSNAKDFSNLIPGHGGFLDRFDSFIVAGAFLSLLSMLITRI